MTVEEELVNWLRQITEEKPVDFRTLSIPDTAASITPRPLHDGYYHPISAQVVKTLQETAEALPLTEIGQNTQWGMLGSLDELSTAFFLRSPIKEGRVAIHDDNTFSVVW